MNYFIKRRFTNCSERAKYYFA